MEDVSMLMPVTTGVKVVAEVIYNGPITAPIEKDQQIAELVITPPSLPETRIPLVAANDVPAGGFMSRVGTVAQMLIAQLNEPPSAPADQGS
jgi:D-alanyl-D-alanine carboxypeptidase (penicillin-binding protein 5/6)